MGKLKDMLLMKWRIADEEDHSREMREAVERERRLRESLMERERRRILVYEQIKALRGQ